MFKRAIVIVLDSVGIGELPDAAQYGDQGSDTLGHIARRVPLRHADAASARSRSGRDAGRIAREPTQRRGAVGRMAEASAGKDSVTGHWEMMGVVLDAAVSGVPERVSRPTSSPSFRALTGRGVLGNKAASGTAIIDELGRRAHAHRLAHRLHVGRQRVSDRRARGGRAGA